MVQPGPPPIPPYPPPLPPYAYPPPSPKSSNIVLIIVLVVVIVVVITVVLAAVLYIMVAGLLTGPDGQRPIVSFGGVTITGSTASFTVAAASQSVPFGTYSANLIVNSTVGTSRPVSPSFTITVGTDSFQVTFTDANSDGRLGGGDRFQVTAISGWRPGLTYEFELLWTDLTPVAFTSWST